jgi:hypothetical protein
MFKVYRCGFEGRLVRVQAPNEHAARRRAERYWETSMPIKVEEVVELEVRYAQGVIASTQEDEDDQTNPR